MLPAAQVLGLGESRSLGETAADGDGDRTGCAGANIEAKSVEPPPGKRSSSPHRNSASNASIKGD
jgi:hypothetical protein